MDKFIISIFSENKPGLLSRVVATFTKRYINILSLTTSKSSLKGVHKFTIVVEQTEPVIKKVVAQLEKHIEVFKAFYYKEKEVVSQEVALYKIPTESFMGGNTIERIIRKHNARILAIEPEYTVVEKTGHQNETEALLHELQKIGIFEFVRSGVVSITKDMEPLKKHLKNMGMTEEMFNEF